MGLPLTTRSDTELSGWIFLFSPVHLYVPVSGL